MADALNSFSLPDLDTTIEDIYTAPTSSVVSVLSCILGNKTATATTVDAVIVRSGGTPTLYIVRGAPVPSGGALDVIVNKPIVLTAGDKLRARAVALLTIDVIGSVFEQIP